MLTVCATNLANNFNTQNPLRAGHCLNIIYMGKGIEKDNPFGLSFLVFTLDKADMARY